jgi:hypothetical protein
MPFRALQMDFSDLNVAANSQQENAPSLVQALAEQFPISVHGVGLSIGGEGALDADHLARLKHLCDWLNPASFPEHLAWSAHDSHFLNDLLPLPYTQPQLPASQRILIRSKTRWGGKCCLKARPAIWPSPKAIWTRLIFWPRSQNALVAASFSTSTTCLSAPRT